MKKAGLPASLLACLTIITISIGYSASVFAATVTWDFYDKFPTSQQGANGFYILWGTKLDTMKESNCYPSEDEPSGAPQQWKGGTTYATLSQSFWMPGEGVIGTKWVASESGMCEVTLKWELSQAAKAQIKEPTTFDGFEMGIVNKAGTKLYSKKATLVNSKESKTISINLKKDEYFLVYMDKLSNQDYDSADVELVIKQTVAGGATTTPSSKISSSSKTSSSTISSSITASSLASDLSSTIYSSNSSSSAVSSDITTSSEVLSASSASEGESKSGGIDVVIVILISVAMLFIGGAATYLIMKNKMSK